MFDIYEKLEHEMKRFYFDTESTKRPQAVK